VLEDVMGMRSSGVVHVGIAQNGLLAYVAGAPQTRQSHLVWRDRDGGKETLAAPVAGYLAPSLSPDRTRVAAQVEGATTFDIWTYNIEQETLTRLTFAGDNTEPVWSPDGRRVAFASVRDNALMSAYVKAADGSGEATMVYSPDSFDNAGQVIPRGWTPDGRTMILEFTDENANNVAILDELDGQLKVLMEAPASESQATLSPDGRWLAYTSDEAGMFQVFVREFPGPGGKWQVSTAGGLGPAWSSDGSELFFRDQNDLLVVKVAREGASFKAGRPEVVFDDLRVMSAIRDYDVFDSKRILIVESAGEDTSPAGVTVVVNWLDDLERRVPR
jgi:serine/threonine-protein kinase